MSNKAQSTLTCEDLDSIGVYFIEGNSFENRSLTITHLAEEDIDAIEEANFNLSIIGLSKVVFFEAKNGKINICYTKHEEEADKSPTDQSETFIDCELDDIEALIKNTLEVGDNRFVRLGNYYIINYNCLTRINLGDYSLQLTDRNHYPVFISAPKLPEKKLHNEFASLMTRYSKHPFEAVKETMPKLASYILSVKRHDNFISSLKNFKEILKEKFEH